MTPETMLEILKMPEAWFGSAAIVGSLMIGYIAYEIASFHFRRKKEEVEPKFDFEAMKAEMDELFGTPASKQN